MRLHAIHEKHQAIDYSDSIARLENSHGRATKSPIQNSRPKSSAFLSNFTFLNPKITGRQKGGFVKGWFWRMCPRSGLHSGGTCESTFVLVLVPGEPPNGPSFRFSFRVEHLPKPPFWKTTLLSTPEKMLHIDFLLTGETKNCRLEKQQSSKRRE